MSRYRDEPPPDGKPEQRKSYRREADEEVRVISEGAVDVVPVVRKAIRSRRAVTVSLASASLLLGGATAKVDSAVRERGEVTAKFNHTEARIDTLEARFARLSVRIDSVLTVLTDVRQDVATGTYIQCVQLRRHDDDLRRSGCDAAERRSKSP